MQDSSRSRSDGALLQISLSWDLGTRRKMRTRTGQILLTCGRCSLRAGPWIRFSEVSRAPYLLSTQEDSKEGLRVILCPENILLSGKEDI